ncbi:MAG TPA: DUF177 domain-containing protein [Candidatus Omnitrophota bacterium]|nr:DUF177 domain-containing protein [Candidatus Omnitrophota bacterium]HPS37485.1 DUF177 domain-containing protein [Candidatus Omnitrophota bacterium]
MKFILADLKEGVPVEVSGAYDAKAIEVEFPDMLFTEPIRLSGSVEKAAGTLRFQGQLCTAVKRHCGRCLKEAAETIDRDFDWIYDLHNKEEIEPVEDVRELLIIEHPLVHLCRAECKGLCTQCGKDLNEGACKCKEIGYHSTPVIIKKSKSNKEKK